MGRDNKIEADDELSLCVLQRPAGATRRSSAVMTGRVLTMSCFVTSIRTVLMARTNKTVPVSDLLINTKLMLVFSLIRLEVSK